MKYKHILNDEIIYQTDDAGEFMLYLLLNDNAKQAKYVALQRLLEKVGEFDLKLVNASYYKA